MANKAIENKRMLGLAKDTLKESKDCWEKDFADNADVKKLLAEIFKLCDSTVWFEDWYDFHLSFEKLLKQYGYDLYHIYYVKSKREWIKNKRKMYEKWQADKKKAQKRHKNPIIYIKNRPIGKLKK